MVDGIDRQRCTDTGCVVDQLTEGILGKTERNGGIDTDKADIIDDRVTVFYTGFLTVQNAVNRNGKCRIVEIGILMELISGFAFFFVFDVLFFITRKEVGKIFGKVLSQVFCFLLDLLFRFCLL